MKRIVILGISALPFFFASCGGSETDGEGTTTDTTAVVENVVVVDNYTVDAANTVINWKSFDGEEIAHQGTVMASNGSIETTTTDGAVVITAASMVIDMNSISDADGMDKLVGHLKAPDFFDVNTFATTDFTFNRHENDMIYGSVNIIGKSVDIEAPATVTVDGNTLTVAVGEFTVDFAQLQMPFFVAEVDAPAEEKHNSNIGFSATVVGTKAN